MAILDGFEYTENKKNTYNYHTQKNQIRRKQKKSVLGIKTKLAIQIPGNGIWNNRMYEPNQLHGNQKKENA